jgi:prevent-host-death family protein
MAKTYSIYEAKARFSEIVRLVREERQTVTLSYHGRPVAEIRPLEVDTDPVAIRLKKLEATGAVQRPKSPSRAFKPVVRRRGALRRFLEERD